MGKVSVWLSPPLVFSLLREERGKKKKKKVDLKLRK